MIVRWGNSSDHQDFRTAESKLPVDASHILPFVVHDRRAQNTPVQMDPYIPQNGCPPEQRRTFGVIRHSDASGPAVGSRTHDGPCPVYQWG